MYIEGRTVPPASPPFTPFSKVSPSHMGMALACRNQWYYLYIFSGTEGDGVVWLMKTWDWDWSLGSFAPYNTRLELQSLALPPHTTVHSSQFRVHSSLGHFFGCSSNSWNLFTVCLQSKSSISLPLSMEFFDLFFCLELTKLSWIELNQLPTVSLSVRLVSGRLLRTMTTF
jgi:hypothetical protein